MSIDWIYVFKSIGDGLLLALPTVVKFATVLLAVTAILAFAKNASSILAVLTPGVTSAISFILRAGAAMSGKLRGALGWWAWFLTAGQFESGEWLGYAWISQHGLAITTVLVGLTFLVGSLLILTHLPMLTWLALVYALIAIAGIAVGGLLLMYSPRVALLQLRKS